MSQSPQSPNLLQIRDLRVCFDTEEGSLEAVRGVDLDVRSGRTLAIVGESGCGKSVTAYSILRLIQKPGRISGGKIEFNPKDEPPVDIAKLGDDEERLLEIRGGNISMIFQEPMTALSPVHTIGNQIVEAIRLHQNITKQAAENLAIEMLKKVGIPNPDTRLKQYPHEFSGGMRQRIVIAMALVCRPELLIADEPTTALDVTVQAQILRLIREMQSELGMAVIFITHDLGVVAQVADEVAVMYLGCVVESGSVRQVIKSPAHPYTKALLKSLPGHGDPDAPLSSIRGSVPSLTQRIQGCPFAPRCDSFQSGICDIDTPVLNDVGDGHASRCHFAKEVMQDLKGEEAR